MRFSSKLNNTSSSDGDSFNHNFPYKSNKNDNSSPTLLSSSAKQEVVNKERIQRLQQRLNGINSGYENSKHDQFEGIIHKLEALEDRLNSYIHYSNNNLCNIQDQIDKLKRDLEIEKGIQERHHQENYLDIQKLSTRFNELNSADKQSQRDYEARLLRNFQEKAEMLKEEVMKGAHLREEKDHEIQQFCEVELPRFYETLKMENKDRERMEKRIIKHSTDEINRLSESLRAEKLARDEQTSSMLSIIEQVVAEVKSEVQQEHQNRQASEEMLVQLMERTIDQMKESRNL